MKTEILKLLKETDGYLSGQDLCEQLHVSRTAVWKVIKQLQAEGYGIEAVRNKGYHLVEIADVITKAELLSRLSTAWAGKSLEYYPEVDSTNTKAKQLAEMGAPHGTLVIADNQIAGKGRRGRSWVSSPGTGIWMSMILRPQLPPACASMLTLVAALAVAAGLDRETGLESQIKWPNDIVVDKKKICGILTEMSSELDCIHYVVVGIGINVNMMGFPQEIEDKATSLYLQTGEFMSRSGLISSVMEAFEGYYSTFMRNKDLSDLVQEYNKKLAGCGFEVSILAPDHEYTGTSLGIAENGELLVELNDGTVKRVVSGEVSVRGIFGYV